MHLAIFGEITKSDFTYEQAEQSALILFGNGTFDLTKRPMGMLARLDVFSIFGSAKVIVPAGTRVVTGGVAIFGAAKVESDSEVGPEVHIRYLALFGSVEVIEGKPAPFAATSGQVFPY